MFEGGQYLDAQQLLTGVDRSRLSASEQATRDDYLSRVEVAITMFERSIRELDDADTAMNAAKVAGSPELARQERDSARALLQRVLANEYANEVVRVAARAKLRDLDAVAAPAPDPPQHREVAPAAPDHADEPASHGHASEELAATDPQPAAGITEDDVASARTLNAEADAMARTSRYDEAERLYGAALAAVPVYPEAVAGLERLQRHRENTVGSRGDSIIEATKTR